MILCAQYRAWQRKLHALVKDPQNKAEIYACLWMLLNEDSVEKFEENQSLFIQYWSDKQHKFTEYNRSQYSQRASIHYH